MTDVTVLGLGNMGTALARAFLTKGHATTVWNRTASKAQPLVEFGAQVASDAASAVRAAPISLVCVERYGQVSALLEQAEVSGALAGATIVNLTWGAPEEAREMSAWVAERGAHYLDGDIYDYPEGVGADIPVVPFAGERAVYDRFEGLLSALGPTEYYGLDPAVPNILGAAASVYHHVAVAAFIEAAAYGNHYGVEPRRFMEFNRMVGEPLLDRAVRHGVEQIETGLFHNDQASLRIHHDVTTLNRDDMRRIGQPATMLAAFCDLVEPLLEEKGELTLAAVYEELRTTR